MATFHRRVIRVTGADSPNVRLGLAEVRAGLNPSHRELVPGVLSYAEYLKRLATWDEIRLEIGVHARFYEGAQQLLYPPTWLDAAHAFAETLRGKQRRARGIGIDPAEGGDSTSMAAVDEWGLMELVSRKTPDTSMIASEALAFMRKHGAQPEQVIFDRGGGGKQHADRLRSMGYNVRTLAFGSQPSLPPRRGMRRIEEKKEMIEQKYEHFNMRAELYHTLRLLLDPANHEGRPMTMNKVEVPLCHPWGIPAPDGKVFGPVYGELRRQLAPIPLMYDGEGRMRMLPKHKRDKNSQEKTLTDLIGCSPDEADSVVLAVHAMLHKETRVVAGAAR